MICLTYLPLFKQHFHNNFGLLEILAEDIIKGWGSTVLRGLHQNNVFYRFPKHMWDSVNDITE